MTETGWRFLLLHLVVFSPLLLAGGLESLPFKKSSGKVVAFKDQQKRWNQSWTIDPFTKEGEQWMRATETGEGNYSLFEKEVGWEVESLWKVETRLVPHQVTRHFFDLEEEKRLLTESIEIDWDQNMARFERQDSQGELETEEIEVPQDTLILSGIASALRDFLFGSPEEVSFHLLTYEPELYEVKLQLEGREKVSTPAGEFECFKVEMEADLGLLNLIKFAIPETYFWFSVTEPHHWIQYRGLENGRDSPRITIKATEVGS